MIKFDALLCENGGSEGIDIKNENLLFRCIGSGIANMPPGPMTSLWCNERCCYLRTLTVRRTHWGKSCSCEL